MPLPKPIDPSTSISLADPIVNFSVLKLDKKPIPSPSNLPPYDLMLFSSIVISNSVNLFKHLKLSFIDFTPTEPI